MVNPNQPSPQRRFNLYTMNMQPRNSLCAGYETSKWWKADLMPKSCTVAATTCNHMQISHGLRPCFQQRHLPCTEIHEPFATQPHTTTCSNNKMLPSPCPAPKILTEVRSPTTCNLGPIPKLPRQHCYLKLTQLVAEAHQRAIAAATAAAPAAAPHKQHT